MFLKNIANLCKVAWQCVAGLREGVGVFFHSFILIFLCCAPQGNSLGYRHKYTNYSSQSGGTMVEKREVFICKIYQLCKLSLFVFENFSL